MKRSLTLSWFSKLLAIAVVLTLPGMARAAVVTVPAGLSVGDQYRLAFVTSTMRDALSSDIADYNAFVTSAAESIPELAALGTTWRVIGSTSAIDARDNTDTNPTLSVGVPIYRLDGAVVAHNNADLWDGSPTSPISINELGASYAGWWVWTGTETDGTVYHYDYDRPLGHMETVSGYPGNFPPGSEYNWVRHYSPAPADEIGSFYVISGVLTVVPEPGSIVMGAMGLVAMVGWQLARRKRSARD